jgi:regulator of sirC expression with transglutaminase-like and TPR domain
MLTLLGDEDPGVFLAIRDRLLSAGEPALRLLEQSRLHPDPAIRRRVREILNARAANQFDSEFLAFVLSQGEHFDLEEGVWKFTLTTHPEVNVAAFRAQLDEWAGLVRTQLGPVYGPGVAVDALNDVLFGQLGFRGNSENYFDPANSYLNRVMDRRLGIPISLSAVYLLVGRRLGLPLVGIGMPRHFICRYQTATEEIFIDPFHGGQLLSRLDCRKRLLEDSPDFDEKLLSPVSNRRILQRMIANLHLIHKERRQPAEAERLQRYLVALSR